MKQLNMFNPNVMDPAIEDELIMDMEAPGQLNLF